MLDIVRMRLGRSAMVAVLLAVGAPALAQDESLDELVAEGKTVFEEHCAACHGNSGEGTGNAPPLAGNTNVEARPLIINQVLFGDSDHGMPAFMDVLSDRQVAAVATYVRNSWENNYGIIFPRSVELRRP
jgi:mono/diheme cytochrome c family protein